MHLVEEMRDASKQAPRVMVWSMIFCSVTSWLAALLLLWTAGDWETYMSASQPYVNWFVDVTRSALGGGIFVALIMMGLNFFIIVGTNNAGSRLMWSMARDRGLPFSEYFAKVDPKVHVPLRCMLAFIAVELIIGIVLLSWSSVRPLISFAGLIMLGSDLAFESIISGGGVTLQVGYATPVLVVCIVRITKVPQLTVTQVLMRGRSILPPRPYFGKPIVAIGHPDPACLAWLWNTLLIAFQIWAASATL